jgi:hypothetical protein
MRVIVILSEAKEPKVLESNTLGKVRPGRVSVIDQCQLFLPGPTLDLFFSSNGRYHVIG